MPAALAALIPAGESSNTRQHLGSAFSRLAATKKQFGALVELSLTSDVLAEFGAFNIGNDKVRLPGEPERESKAEREANGIPIDDGSWQALCNAAQKAGVEVADIPS